MIPIYICEDNPTYLKQIQKEINDYLLIQNYDMKIVYATHDPEDFLDTLKDNPKNGVYFLDVDLQHNSMNGFILGQEIRKLDTRGFMIFITTHSELSFETFKYRLEAMDYIVKDDSKNIQDRIRYCLDSVQDRIFKQNNDAKEYLSIKVLNDIFNIDISSIYSIETSSQKHRLIITCEDQQLEFFDNLNSIEEQLNDDFIRIHRSFLINKNKVKTIDIKNSTLTLSNDQICLIARSMKKQVKTMFNC